MTQSGNVFCRQHYLRNGFAIDVMACLPYDLLNIFDTWFKGPSDGSGNGGGAKGDQLQG